jgi:hypothetical protein
MRYLIMLEETESAKRAAADAIRINLDAYRESGKPVPKREPAARHLDNPEFRDLLFAYLSLRNSTSAPTESTADRASR